MTGAKPPSKSGTAVDAFLRQLAAAPAARRQAGQGGRLLFAMDATASREPSWDKACQIQGEMFLVTEALGGLVVQLCYYRGFGEFAATSWLASSAELVRRMTGVACRGGQTQIARVLAHAAAEARKGRVNALVFVGDAFEEDIDAVTQRAGELGVLGVPAFMFHEGSDAVAQRGFETVARLTGGQYCAFDASSAQRLRDLLAAVAIFAAGGRAALEDFGKARGGLALRLLHRPR